MAFRPRNIEPFKYLLALGLMHSSQERCLEFLQCMALHTLFLLALHVSDPSILHWFSSLTFTWYLAFNIYRVFCCLPSVWWSGFNLFTSENKQWVTFTHRHPSYKASPSLPLREGYQNAAEWELFQDNLDFSLTYKQK